MEDNVCIIVHKCTCLRKKTVISPNLLVRKFCGKAQFPNAETMPFHKISTRGN